MHSKLSNIFRGGGYFSLFFAASSALALPVGFKDSWMTMGELGRDYADSAVMYTFGQKTAIGAGVTGLKFKHSMPGHAQAMDARLEVLDLHLAHRLLRWNFPEAQANVYVLGGLGSGSSALFSERQTFSQLGLQADYETRRLYAAAKWHGSYSTSLDYTRYSLAGGFSFYKTEYDEWQPWAVLEASRMGGDMRDSTQLTPYIRFIHKTLFIEAGAPFKSGKSEGLKLNFRYTF